MERQYIVTKSMKAQKIFLGNIEIDILHYCETLLH